jgi:hypothetical protein
MSGTCLCSKEEVMRVCDTLPSIPSGKIKDMIRTDKSESRWKLSSVLSKAETFVPEENKGEEVAK